jgi:hypothetical protein
MMRATLDIDERILRAVNEIARRDGRTAGAVASELIRRALSQSLSLGGCQPATRFGFRPFPATGASCVTNDRIDRLRDDLAI